MTGRQWRCLIAGTGGAPHGRGLLPMADEPAPPLPSSTRPARARRRRIFFGTALFHAALLALVTGAGAETVPPAGRIVVLTSIDGFPAWIWKDPTLAERSASRSPTWKAACSAKF